MAHRKVPAKKDDDVQDNNKIQDRQRKGNKGFALFSCYIMKRNSVLGISFSPSTTNHLCSNRSVTLS